MEPSPRRGAKTGGRIPVTFPRPRAWLAKATPMPWRITVARFGPALCAIVHWARGASWAVRLYPSPSGAMATCCLPSFSNPVAVPVMMRLRWRPSPAARRSLHRRRPTTMAACDFPYPSISIRPAIVVGHRLSYTQSHNCIFSLDRIPRIPNIAAVLVSPWAVFKGIKREHGEASTPLGPQPGLPPQLSAASPRS